MRTKYARGEPVLMMRRDVSLTPARPNHVWLAAIVPENARSFRVQEPSLATTLAEAGAVLVVGGDDVLRSLARRIDVDVSPSKLEALVIAYWLARLGYQLSRYADRTERPVWMRQNVDSVLQALSAMDWR
jgi:hypothetical protein